MLLHLVIYSRCLSSLTLVGQPVIVSTFFLASIVSSFVELCISAGDSRHIYAQCDGGRIVATTYDRGAAGDPATSRGFSPATTAVHASGFGDRREPTICMERHSDSNPLKE